MLIPPEKDAAPPITREPPPVLLLPELERDTLNAVVPCGVESKVVTVSVVVALPFLGTVIDVEAKEALTPEGQPPVGVTAGEPVKLLPLAENVMRYDVELAVPVESVLLWLPTETLKEAACAIAGVSEANEPMTIAKDSTATPAFLINVFISCINRS
jgi:hypothetical protein